MYLMKMNIGTYSNRESKNEDIQGCFPPDTLNSTGLPSEGRSFRSMIELKFVMTRRYRSEYAQFLPEQMSFTTGPPTNYSCLCIVIYFG